MLPAATVGLFRQQCRHPPTAAAARGLIASATRPNLLWMRQEEEMRMLEEERRQQEEQGREQEGSLLALPYPGAEKEATEKGHGEGADADTKDAEVIPQSMGTGKYRNEPATEEETEAERSGGNTGNASS